MRAPIDELIPTRQSLLSRVKDWDDQESWREFFDTYWHLIYGLAVKCGLTDAEAQDVVQETMLSIAKQMPDFKYDPALGSFKGWLLQITRRRITDQFRKRAKVGQVSNLAEAGEMPAFRSNDDSSRTATVHRIPDPASLELDRVWDDEWQQHVMRTALERVKARVSVKQFQIFDLHAVQGLPVSEIARTLGVNIASVYMAKSRVGRLLQRELAHLAKERQ